MMNIMQNHVIL